MKSKIFKHSTKVSIDKKLINRSRAEETISISLKKSFNKSKERVKSSNPRKDTRTSSYDLTNNNNKTSCKVIRMNYEKKNNRNNSIAILDNMHMTNISDFFPNTTQNKTYSNSTFGKYINNLAAKKTTIDSHTVNSSSITANTTSNKTTITNKIKSNKNLIINKLGKSNVSKDFMPKLHNSMTISKDDDENLPSSTKSKLHDVRDNILQILSQADSRYEKYSILRELDNIYKHIVNRVNNEYKDEEEISLNSKNSKNKSPITSHTGSECIEPESDYLKKENIELKHKLESIDNKFDRLSSENNELRAYIKDKSDNVDEMKVMLNTLLCEISKMKDSKMNSERLYSAKKEESVIMHTNESIEGLPLYANLKCDLPKLNFNVYLIYFSLMIIV